MFAITRFNTLRVYLKFMEKELLWNTLIAVSAQRQEEY